jgi:serine/threonine-protein kinase
MPLFEATVIAGKYCLERELASGGMGAVWVARHLALDERVAVKFMAGTLPQTAEARARFAREAQVAARLRGPNVVEVLDCGVDGDLPYLVMELLQGEHLGDRLRREHRLPLPAVASIAAQVARALTRAHAAAIVHRDLKPANLFLARVDGEEVVKVLDFGIAKALSGPAIEATNGDVLLGSPQYMAPEQARASRGIDHRADLWSLAAILFRALTGLPAFEGTSAVDVIVQICTGPTPVPSRVAPELPPELDAFFLRALDRDPARRFASAREMAEALGNIARSAEGRPPADSGVERVRRLASVSTLVMNRRTGSSGADPGGPRLGRDEIEAFVEQALAERRDGLQRRPLDEACGAARGPTVEGPPARPEPPAPESTVPNRRALLWRTTQAGGGPAVAHLADQGFDALRRGDTEGARQAWQQALTLDPSNRPLALNLRRLDALGAGGRP